MNCIHCGAPLDEGARFCASCGSKVQGASTVQKQQNVAPQVTVNLENSIPYQYRPLGAWAYFGYAFLFSIPIVGFICLIIFSLSDDNINRRNFARSYWCALAIVLILFVIVLVLGLVFGFADTLSDSIANMF